MSSLRSLAALLVPLLLQSVPGSCQSSRSVFPSSSREPITRTIEVAKGGHTFVPDITQVEVGDFVEFRFFPKNHSVVRAAYEHPCIPYELIETDRKGFTSGFRPVDAVLDDPPVWEVRINDTDPIFYYCSAPGSCINYEMVGVINPSASTSLEVQRDLAKDSDFMLQPGQDWPDERTPEDRTSSKSSSPSRSTSTPTTTGDGAATTVSGADNVVVASSPALSPGGIAGIVIGGAAVILLAGALVYFCGRDRALSNFARSKRNPGLPTDFENGGVQYVHAVPKHHSGMTMASSLQDPNGYLRHSPALPGYNGPSERRYSPPRAHYPPSDALSPATPMVRSPSPGSAVAPAYSKSPTLRSQSQMEHGAHGLHEMDGGGGFQTSNSTRKTGVERYS